MNALLRLIAHDLGKLLWDGLVLTGFLQAPCLQEEYWRRMRAQLATAQTHDRRPGRL